MYISGSFSRLVECRKNPLRRIRGNDLPDKHVCVLADVYDESVNVCERNSQLIREHRVIFSELQRVTTL